jgi:hypothetical protein
VDNIKLNVREMDYEKVSWRREWVVNDFDSMLFSLFNDVLIGRRMERWVGR